MPEQTHDPVNKRDEQIDKLADMLERQRVAMVTTAEPDGTLHSRPMMLQKTRFEGTLFFVTKQQSPKVTELKQDQNVSVTVTDEDGSMFVALRGPGEIVHDRELLKGLWHSDYEAWFPEGLDEPGLVLLQVKVDEAQYWHGVNLAQEAVEFVRGLVGDHEPTYIENERVNV